MKKTVLVSVLCIGTYLVFTSNMFGPITGGGGNRTGAAGSASNCNGSTCHAANTPNTVLALKVEDKNAVEVTDYVPGEKYTIIMSGQNATPPGHPKYGLQLAAVKASDPNQQAGSFSAGASTNSLTIKNTSGIEVVEHTTPIAGGSAGGSTYLYVNYIDWTAPAQGSGDVMLYYTLNAVNGDSKATNDEPNHMTKLLAEGTSVGEIAHRIQLRAYPNPAGRQLYLEFDQYKPSVYTIEIFNVAGSVLSSSDVRISNSSYTTFVNTSDFKPGLYFARVTNEGDVRTISFVKQ